MQPPSPDLNAGPVVRRGLQRAAGENTPTDNRTLARWLARRDLLLAVAWFALALVVLWRYDLVGHKLDADASFMLYAGQQILNGRAPYVGVAIVKLPVAPFVAAAGIAAGRAFGLDDILSGRLAFWLCAAAAVAASYVVGAQLGRALARSAVSDDAATPRARVAGWLLGALSAGLLLGAQAFGLQVAEGPEAKLPMIAAGLVALALAGRWQWGVSGAAAALSFLAWQPGLIFVPAVLLASWISPVASGPASRPAQWRALLWTLAGVALPLLAVGLYLAANGALDDMVRQAFGANANYFGEKKIGVGLAGVIAANARKVWAVSLECSVAVWPLTALHLAGAVGGSVALAALLWRRRERTLWRTGAPLLLSAAGLGGFSLLDLQKCSDLTPLLPYYALGGGALLLAVVWALARVWSARTGGDACAAVSALGGAVALVITIYAVLVGFAQAPQTLLAQQRGVVAQIAAQLGPGDGVQQFGDTVLLVMTRRENATRFVHLGEKQGLGILTAEGVTLDDLIAQLAAANPRLITLSRAKSKDWARPLYTWIEAHYTLASSIAGPVGGFRQDLDVYWRR